MWSLDINSGDISWSDNKISRLSTSETNILRILISHRGELVSKDELIDAGWPQKIVSPNSLTVVIKNIRKCISSVDSDTYIETAHRKGYILHCGSDNFAIKNRAQCAEIVEDKSTIIEKTRAIFLQKCWERIYSQPKNFL